MINAIIGELVSAKDDTVVLRTSGGVEYSMICSTQTVAKVGSLQGEDRKDVRVLTILSHHEDLMQLYGFADEREREAFKALLGVNGIAARGALKILSGISVDNLASALDGGNVKLLSGVPGVGPKTAQKMILALRGKLVLDEDEEKPDSEKKQSVENLAVVDGLVGMGYDRRAALKAVAHVEESEHDKLAKLTMHDQEALVFRLALKYLG